MEGVSNFGGWKTENYSTDKVRIKRSGELMC